MFCEHCGNKISEGEQFCSHCGTKCNTDYNTTQDSTVNSNPTTNITEQPITNNTPTTKKSTFSKYKVPIFSVVGLVLVIAIMFIVKPKSQAHYNTNNNSISKTNPADEKTCKKIKKVVEKALVDEDIYDTLATFLDSDNYIFEVKPGGTTTSFNQLNDLISSNLKSLKKPTEKGKDTYYVRVICYEETLLEVNVITGTFDTVPTNKNFTQSKNVSILMDISTCLNIESCVNAALANEDTYNEVLDQANDDGYIFEIKPKGKAKAGKYMNEELADSLDSLITPNEKGKDTYYVYIEVENNYYSNNENYSSLGSVNVITGKSGSKPSKKDFDKNPYENLEYETEEDETVDPSVDDDECSSIESCINAALAEESVYKETAKLIDGSYIIFEIKPGGIADAGEYMNNELKDMLKALRPPKQKNKDTYYVYIEGNKYTDYDGSTIHDIGKIVVITGSSDSKPSKSDF